VVGLEKSKVEVENQKALAEANNCARIKKEVEMRKAETERDLKAAEPLIER